ncbi:MAG: hypothetical protein IIW77_07315 [Bacteroidaceae bacterium]|nr:hypothetical protein [Bacteroidaceae bacterium]
MRKRNVFCLSALLLAVVACTTVEKASDVHHFSQSSIAEHVKVDSIVLHDSIFIRERCDTVFYTKYRTIYKERLRVDTVLRCDTLFRDREVVVEKVNEVRNRLDMLWRVPLAILLFFLLWKAGVLPAVWNFILKGVESCKRIFHSKE